MKGGLGIRLSVQDCVCFSKATNPNPKLIEQQQPLNFNELRARICWMASYIVDRRKERDLGGDR